LRERRLRDGNGNNVAAFIQRVMSPGRYRNDVAAFTDYRQQLNDILVLAGIALGEDGQFIIVDRARTLAEAQLRAGRLRAVLFQRGVHPDVLTFCRSELVEDNYFHAVFEAVKSIAEKIRSRSGVSSDGAPLIDAAFGIGNGMPLLAFNSLKMEAQQSEQKGLINLLKGTFGTFRNTTAHAPKVHWHMTERDALDLLTLASFLHCRLDDCVSTSPQAVL
jgi:uncharacterized protein (TIGR02391 family)